MLITVIYNYLRVLITLVILCDCSYCLDDYLLVFDLNFEGGYQTMQEFYVNFEAVFVIN